MADRRELVSAALDGDGPMPDDLDADEAAFLDAATRIRSLVRLEEAAVPPDVTGAVLAEIHRPPPPVHRRPVWQAAAAVFVVAALATAVATRPGGPLAPTAAQADVGAEVLAAQHDVAALDARLVLVERGPHPDVAERRYEGTLRYRAPEELWLHLEQVDAVAPGFPANDLDLVVDEGTAWSEGLRACPVGEQPRCLSPSRRAVSGLAPFAADWLAPLDLVVPTGAFLPSAAVDADESGSTTSITTTVARVQRTVDGLRAAGALRAVHPTDAVHLELDAATATIRRLTVVAGGTPARAAWAASNGYADPAGATLLDLTVDPTAPIAAPPAPRTASSVDAGFVDGAPADPIEPAWLPDGYRPGRSGEQADVEPAVAVRSWTDGRGWIRVDVVRDRPGEQLLGGLGPIVRRVDLGNGGGVGYVDPGGSVVALHAEEGIDVAVTGSVPVDVLLRVAASVPVTGAPLPAGWPQGQVLESLPDGALRGADPIVARYDDTELLLVLPGPGGTSAVLAQHPGTSLGPPAQVDAAEVAVRGVTGRYDAAAQRIRWVEGGWVRSLEAAGLDLDQLLALAGELEPA